MRKTELVSRILSSAKKYFDTLAPVERGAIAADIATMETGDFRAVSTKQLKGHVRELRAGDHRITYFKSGDEFMKISKTKKNTGSLKWHSFQEVFDKGSKSKEFRKGYRDEMTRLRLSKQIKHLRSAKKLTQKAVAQRAGMPQSVIARLESGEHSFSLDTLERIAGVFDKKIQLV
jgi:DNA-binding XRE family transcriptional regulator